VLLHLVHLVVLGGGEGQTCLSTPFVLVLLAADTVSGTRLVLIPQTFFEAEPSIQLLKHSVCYEIFNQVVFLFHISIAIIVFDVATGKSQQNRHAIFVV
jgi:hypothetical protein